MYFWIRKLPYSEYKFFDVFLKLKILNSRFWRYVCFDLFIFLSKKYINLLYKYWEFHIGTANGFDKKNKTYDPARRCHAISPWRSTVCGFSYSLRAGYRTSKMPRFMKFLTWNRFDCCRQRGTPIVRRRTGSLMRGRAFKLVKFSTKKTVSERGWKSAYVLKSMRESREKIVIRVSES